MPHTKAIRRFSRPRAGIKGPLGRYIVQFAEADTSSLNLTPRSDIGYNEQKTFKIKGTLSPLKPLTNHVVTIKRNRKGKMRLINLEFKSMDKAEVENAKEHVAPITTTLTFSDYLCKWCLSYVGQRRQFCSADCAAQFKLCQQKRDQRQNLNISVDYYGNVKLSIQGLPINSTEDVPVNRSIPTYPAIGGGGKRSRRRKRCRNCAKLLSEDAQEDFCDETCQTMDGERTKREDFVNIFQQKEAAERRRIRKWLLDAQDQYTKQEGEGETDGFDVTSGPAALNPLPVIRTPFLPPEPPKPSQPTPLPQKADFPTRSGGPSHLFRRTHCVTERYHLRKDEAITGGPVTLNPIPLRRGPLRPDKRALDPDKRHLMVDLKWIPKFFS